MDAINAITQKADRTRIAGASEEFKTVSDGFASLLQLTGNKGTVDNALSAAESEFLRVDDNRDLVRDSHTLNNSDANNDDADEASEVDEPDSDDDTRSADDDSNDETSDQETSDSSEDSSADENAASGENQDAAAGSAETQNQPQVAGDGIAADLNVIEGAAAAAAAAVSGQTKTNVETTVTQTSNTQTVQAVAATDANAGQNATQNQQGGTDSAQKLTAVQNETVDRSLTPTENQAAQTAAAAAQTRIATAQQNTAQTNQAQTQQGPQLGQERTQNQSTEIRSAAAQAQSQDLSQRLGDDARARVQVNVTGQQAAQTTTEPGQFNRFVGYNPADSRTVSTANGQAGLGAATNAAIASTDTPAERPAAQTTAPIPTSAPQPHTQAAQPGLQTLAGRAEPAAMAPRGESNLAQSGNGQSNASTNANTTTAPQPTAQATATQSGQTFAQTVQQTASANSPPAPTSSQVIEQIKVNINKSVKAGMDRVTIQLRPENLGRIEVKMELSQDGKVRALVTAESRETLDLLQRDARGLERALQDAGLRTDSNNLHFELKSEQQAGQNNKQNGTAANDNGDAEDLTDEQLEEMEYDRAQAAASRGGVDQTV